MRLQVNSDEKVEEGKEKKEEDDVKPATFLEIMKECNGSELLLMGIFRVNFSSVVRV